MLRRAMVVLPLYGAAAALLGVLIPRAIAVVAALLLGVVVQAVLGSLQERRLGQVADRVAQLVGGTSTVDLRAAGSPQWRRLVAGLDAVEASLAERFDDLASERARVERLLDQQPAAVLLFDDSGLVFANPRAEALFGLLPTEAMGRTPLQVLTVRALADAVAEAHETGRTVQVEVETDGRSLAALASETSEGEGEVALIVSDITETRRVEAIRRDFVTNASHELKTPVAGIQALSESIRLALDRDPPRARRMVERLPQEAGRLAQLVRELLDLARLEEGAAQRSRRVDMAGLVRTQLDRVEGRARQRRVEVRCRCDDDATVVAVPEDVRLVVANLLDNAVQYTPAGGRVDVRVRRTNGDVVLEVGDTGIGIAEADRDRIFERFYRVDKARSRAVGGTGLGLSIVRHAVQRHGGEVTVHSVLGEGSTFRVRLPVEGRPPEARG